MALSLVVAWARVAVHLAAIVVGELGELVDEADERLTRVTERER